MRPSPSTATRWEPVVGLEVHVQLATQSKMFCRCPARFGSPPNTHVCPTCSGQPGTLPVLNADALRLGVLAGLALGCTVDPSTKFDRKNYFYPDLPKGYQISQFDRPLCRDGVLDYELPDGGSRRVHIVRAHLEEDSGKIVHPGGMDISLVDLNRAGTPLLEIVSAPDLRSTAEASAYLQALRRVLRYAGVSECDMEKGSFRCDANISLRPAGTETLGTRTEVKNLNSFRFVAQALQAEIERQTRVLDGGGTVTQATMAFDPSTGRTSTMRTKEEAHDYRYFPEPDLPEFTVDPAWVAELRALLPEDPTARHARFVDALGLPARDADSLIAERELADYFEATLAAGSGDASGTANWILTDVLRLSNERKLPLRDLATTPERLAPVVRMVSEKTLSVQAGRTIITQLEARPDRNAEQLVKELDLGQVSDESELATLIAQVIEAETDLVERYRGGKTSVLNALLGAVMKASGGKANPNTVREMLAAALAAD